MHLPRHAENWLLPYLGNRLHSAFSPAKPRRVWVAITDHYEPFGLEASIPSALRRVALWRDRWPRIADDAPRDSVGQPPQYSFFYPQEEYHREILDGVAEIVRLNVADVEVHLHHDHDNADSFTRKVHEFCARLTNDHGLLRQVDGRTVFGFIHGNWALDNSRPDGRWCGVPGEIRLLRDLGCYADFTMPSAPSATQSKVVNQIYWCTNRADSRPRSFDSGIRATPGGGRRGDLLMITGPLGLRSRGRFALRLEAGEIAGYDLPTPERVRHWLRLAPSIGDDLFLKLYTHGGADRNLTPLLEDGLANLYLWLAQEAAQQNLEVRWVTAWQMYQAAHGLIGPTSNFGSLVVPAAEVVR
ncbi:MAG TPA: hypothetical protein VMV57_15505 [Terracidiphilus sp.]|nr:hypothetical protein [Terracidiphilus sp.]